MEPLQPNRQSYCIFKTHTIKKRRKVVSDNVREKKEDDWKTFSERLWKAGGTRTFLNTLIWPLMTSKFDNHHTKGRFSRWNWWLTDLRYSWEQVEDMLSDWRFKQQRALLWHASYFSFSVSLLHTYTHGSLSANSCPTQIGSIICSAGLHKRTHIDIWSGSIAFRAVRHLNTPVTSPQAHVMKCCRSVRWKERSRWRRSFPRSLSVKW